MFLRHRVGISFGLVVTIILGGALGFLIGANAPGIVFGLGNPAAGTVAALLFATIGSVIWLIGEAIVGIAGAVGRDATLLRVGISLFGSFGSTVTSGLTLLGVHPFPGADPHSIFAYGPIASGLGAVALGGHALLHQLHLDRLARR
ncbi:MAG: hypothetical protein H0X24_12680 [Ktedonobacterales bacterium]|nr:hypothetical protein [Ktedonobacterales bacterium]